MCQHMEKIGHIMIIGLVIRLLVHGMVLMGSISLITPDMLVYLIELILEMLIYYN